MAHELQPLPYAYDALEPHIDAQTMEIHYSKHHNGYVAKLNAALEGHADLAETSIGDLLKNLDAVPEDIRTAVRNNAGGHANHSLFWDIMSPNGGGEPEGELAQAINSSFGSFADFKEKFSTAAASVFGSGWAFLIIKDGKLEIVTKPNQDSPISDGYYPLFALDVWEHAYYLKHQNKRPDYIESFWNVVDWSHVSDFMSKAQELQG
jgi:Fe-Mn family superoxide dismutase